MAKTKTSKKRATFSLSDAPIVKLKDPKASVAYSPTAILRDRGFTARALFDAFMAGDKQAFKEIVRNHYEAINTVQALKEAKLSHRTFYAALSEGGNPSLDTLMKIVRVIGKEQRAG